MLSADRMRYFIQDARKDVEKAKESYNRRKAFGGKDLHVVEILILNKLMVLIGNVSTSNFHKGEYDFHIEIDINEDSKTIRERELYEYIVYNREWIDIHLILNKVKSKIESLGYHHVSTYVEYNNTLPYKYKFIVNMNCEE